MKNTLFLFKSTKLYTNTNMYGILLIILQEAMEKMR